MKFDATKNAEASAWLTSAGLEVLVKLDDGGVLETLTTSKAVQCKGGEWVVSVKDRARRYLCEQVKPRMPGPWRVYQIEECFVVAESRADAAEWYGKTYHADDEIVVLEPTELSLPTMRRMTIGIEGEDEMANETSTFEEYLADMVKNGLKEAELFGVVEGAE